MKAVKWCLTNPNTSWYEVGTPLIPLCTFKTQLLNLVQRRHHRLGHHINCNLGRTSVDGFNLGAVKKRQNIRMPNLKNCTIKRRKSSKKNWNPRSNTRQAKLTVRRLLTPLRPAAKCPSWALLPDRENIGTGEPSSWNKNQINVKLFRFSSRLKVTLT